MALHGRTKIELTDVHTGKVETIEKSNFVTNGVAEFNKPLGGVLDSHGLVYGQNLVPFYGSLALFDTPVEGDENTLFPAASNICTGAAEYGTTNGTTDTWLGSYNANESNIDVNNRTATFVYDFTTAQCNGNIGSVCLMPQNCGVGGVWGVTGGMNRDGVYNISTTKSNGSHIATTNTTLSSDVLFKPYTDECVWDGDAKNQLRPITIDMENAIGYYVNFSASPRTLEKRKLNFDNVSLFDTVQNTTSTLLESHELGKSTITADPCYFCPPTDYDLFDETHFYTFYYSPGGEKAAPYTGEIYLVVWSLVDGSFTKAYTFTFDNLKHAVGDFYPYYYNGYAYFPNSTTYDVYRAPISNPTAFETATKSQDVLDNTTAYPLRPSFELNGRIYMVISKVATFYYMLMINTETFEISFAHFVSKMYFRLNLYGERAMPVKNRPLLRIARCSGSYSGYGVQTNTNWLENFRIFLSTINNLDSIVTKTSDKTMKITYTLTEVAE